MKKWLLGLFLLVALGAAAQELQVAYTEGRVELAVGGGWRELAPGDRIASNAKIRLAQDGFVELAQGATRFSVSQPGVYLVADLVSASNKVASWKLSQVVGGKLKAAVSGGARGDSSTVGGVRADMASAPKAVTWDTGSQEALKEGLAKLDEGRFDDALAVFQDALEAYPGEEAIFYYFIATTHSRQQQIAKAMRALQNAALEPGEPMYMEVVLLKGQLLLQSLAFDEALALFDNNLSRNTQGGFAQALLILSAYSYQGLGKGQRAREALEKAVRLDPASEQGREAAQLLTEL
jgi:Flp pilus assembly protein TadD